MPKVSFKTLVSLGIWQMRLKLQAGVNGDY